VAANLLRFENISKSFPGVRALQDVSFSVAGGSVHALLGENGAGKSTLLKILSGLYRPDAGRFFLDDQPLFFHSTADAIRSGITVIHQELQLVPEMSVAENLFLGHLPNRLGFLQRRQLLQRTIAQLSDLGEKIDPRARTASLPIAQRQMVEIAKALSRDAKVIAFDEPTSSLSGPEVQRLFAVIRKLRAAGRVILYVSHRMEEIFQICDKATVLRDGRLVETFDQPAQVGHDVLVRAMVGRSISDVFSYSPRPQGAPALEVRDLRGPGVIAPATFSVARGQIVGVFGLVGAGRTELLKLIYGATRATSGHIRVDSNPVKITSPSDAIATGVVLCPEDRKREGIIPQASVLENVNLSGRRHFSRLGFFLRRRHERENAARFVRELQIRTPSLSQQIVYLSGGNQQKAILARWLSERVRVLLLDEPTRGIDIGAKGEIYSIIYKLAQQGTGVLLVSSEMPEVLGVCDRILVMRQGSIVADLKREQATPERVLQLALPVSSSSFLSPAVEAVTA